MGREFRDATCFPQSSHSSRRPGVPLAAGTGLKSPARRPKWTAMGVVILAASAASLGVSRYKLSPGVSPIEMVGLDGTAFEGTIQPSTTFTLAAPATSIVKQVFVTVGDRVAAGQPLLLTDDREAAAAGQAAALDVRAAQARMEDLQRRLALINRRPAEQMARVSAKLSSAERDVFRCRPGNGATRRTRPAAFDQARTRLDRAELADQGS